MSQPTFISADFIEKHTDYRELIEALRLGFSKNEIVTPNRHHHEFPNTQMGVDTTMLLMPSWQDSTDAGVKVVNVSPNNYKNELPSIQGIYVYMDAMTGRVKAIIDAPKLTSKRTAAASALASSFLSNENSQVILMLGTGVLSTELVIAHSSIRPLRKAMIWGRNKAKAHLVKEKLKQVSIEVSVCTDIASEISKADIVSAATLSKTPLINGECLVAGQHIDLVGSFRPDMREADDAVVRRADLYVDTLEMALRESGDLKIPLDTQVIDMDDIEGDLFSLCSGRSKGRIDVDSITMFKSVGHALEDLIAARYYYEKWINVNGI